MYRHGFLAGSPPSAMEYGMCDLKIRGAAARSRSSALRGYVQLLSTQCSESRSVAPEGFEPVVSSTMMYDSHVEPDLGYETKQISEGRVLTVRDNAYRSGVMYGGITRPSTSRYLYPCSPMRRSSGRSAWISSEY